MKLARLGLVVIFAALVGSSTSYSAVLLTAHFSFGTAAVDLKSNPKPVLPLGGDAERVVGGLNRDVNGIPLLVSTASTSEHGQSNAVAHVTVRAQVGSIGVGVTGDTNAAFTQDGGPPGSRTDSGGEARVLVDEATAGWIEFVVPTVRNKAVGAPIIFNTLLVIDGQMSANVIGGEHNKPGYANAFLQIIEDNSGSTFPVPPPSGDLYWARLQEDPTSNTHIVELPPDIIRVRHEMNNGLAYSFANRMNLTADTRAVDGGSSFFDADFSASLKWGGVESVTDGAGNPIPREDWSIESESGFDYSKPFVPEPSSILLLATALCARLALGRRRR